jgi:iron(III) transport system substrate-binding protein
VEKVLTEARAGRYPDVVLQEALQISYLAGSDLFERYEPPEKEIIRSEFSDALGRFIGFGINPLGLVYNTKSVAADKLPQSYEDLLDPRWNKRFTFNTEDIGWVIGIVEHMGKAKGDKYIENLSKQQPAGGKGHSLQIQKVAAGEYDFALPSYAHLVSNFKRKGAPVDFVYLSPVFTNYNALGLVKQGKHKAAGKLLIRFLISREGQEAYAKTGRVPARRDVKPIDAKLLENIEFSPFKGEWASTYKAYGEFVQKLFMQGR